MRKKSHRQNVGQPRNLSLLSALTDEWRLPRQLLQLFLHLPRLSPDGAQAGFPVMVLPGYMTTDRSTFFLRRFLAWHGFDVFPWGLGLNRGNTMEFVHKVADRCRQILKKNKHPVALIGWSWGGYIAREVARDYPALVHHVVTLGSPIVGGAQFTAWAGINRRRGVDLDTIARAILERTATPITVPITSIYSKSDKVVSWKASIDEDKRHRVTNHEVNSSHAGLGMNREVYRILIETLKK